MCSKCSTMLPDLLHSTGWFIYSCVFIQIIVVVHQTPQTVHNSLNSRVSDSQIFYGRRWHWVSSLHVNVNVMDLASSLLDSCYLWVLSLSWDKQTYFSESSLYSSIITVNTAFYNRACQAEFDRYTALRHKQKLFYGSLLFLNKHLKCSVSGRWYQHKSAASSNTNLYLEEFIRGIYESKVLGLLHTGPLPKLQMYESADLWILKKEEEGEGEGDEEEEEERE